MNQQEKLAHPVNEAAALVGIGRSSLYKLIGSNQVRSILVGGRRLIPHSELVALVEGTGRAA